MESLRRFGKKIDDLCINHGDKVIIGLWTPVLVFGVGASIYSFCNSEAKPSITYRDVDGDGIQDQVVRTVETKNTAGLIQFPIKTFTDTVFYGQQVNGSIVYSQRE